MSIKDVHISDAVFISRYPNDPEQHVRIPVFVSQPPDKNICVPYLSLDHIYVQKYCRGRSELAIHSTKIYETYSGTIIIPEDFVNSIQVKMKSTGTGNHTVKVDQIMGKTRGVRVYNIPENIYNICRTRQQDCDKTVIASYYIEFVLILEGCTDVNTPECVLECHNKKWRLVGYCSDMVVDRPTSQ